MRMNGYIFYKIQGNKEHFGQGTHPFGYMCASTEHLTGARK